VLARAPREWTTWRDDLLEGTIDPVVGTHLGEALAVWHRDTSGSHAPLADFGSTDSFVELRTDPYFRFAADRHPLVAQRVEHVANRLLTTKACLVHGDFSPKNVMTGDGSQWVLDWEVAHIGDSHFDLAFLISHLVLKAVHRPASAMSYHSVARGFVNSYRKTEGSLPISRDDLAETLACLLLARVDGKSPAAYLSAADQDRVRELALHALSSSPADALGTWVRG